MNMPRVCIFQFPLIRLITRKVLPRGYYYIIEVEVCEWLSKTVRHRDICHKRTREQCGTPSVNVRHG